MIASHTHRLSTDLLRSERHEEQARSRERIEAVTGARVEGFRAPAFDFGSDYLSSLAAAGYAYDASVVSCRRIPGWYGGEHDLHRPSPATAVDPDAPEGLVEVLTTVMTGVGLPLTGTWTRFFGPRYMILSMRLLARRGIAPVLYVYPWELADLPAVAGVPKRRVRADRRVDAPGNRTDPFKGVRVHERSERARRETGRRSVGRQLPRDLAVAAIQYVSGIAALAWGLTQMRLGKVASLLGSQIWPNLSPMHIIFGYEHCHEHSSKTRFHKIARKSALSSRPQTDPSMGSRPIHRC